MASVIRTKHRGILIQHAHGFLPGGWVDAQLRQALLRGDHEGMEIQPAALFSLDVEPHLHLFGTEPIKTITAKVLNEFGRHCQLDGIDL
ncbi:MULTISPECIES: hypothetical protein [unclassified Marinovum]|uniref:hypothetical protein n=1 Tax=unclassified Marinovum TaxID=2647166 RepID=UPI0026E3C94A|nr:MULTISPECIES: hypothetical protein [unclassified Marinovum]